MTKTGWIPKEQRKKILLLSDDMRMTSGVGVISKEIVCKTAHRYNWTQLAAAVKHPEEGKLFDMSDAVNTEAGLTDALVRLYPSSGYGNPQVLRFLLDTEKPDAILHFTDPRFWIWLYQMEHEVRMQAPIVFYHIWDDTPYPKYNENFYRSCNWIGCISKQTYNIVKQVWQNGKDKESVEDWQISYVPHGVDTNIFRPLTTKEELNILAEWRKKIFGNAEIDFVVFWNNRNIRRKMTGDVILAYDHFLKQIPKEKADRCRLLMHTQPVDENGTDIPAVVRDCTPDAKVIFSTDKLPPNLLNILYNIADVTINLASNEGFGISTMESLSAARPIIVNITGGLQDQCGFTDDDGNLLDPDKHFNYEFGTNAWGTYKKCGSWALPVFPTQRGLIGSPQTPYIFDDRCDWREAGIRMLELYNTDPETRKQMGQAGRQYALDYFSAEHMGQCFIDGMDQAFAKWAEGNRPARCRIFKGI